MSKSAFQRTCLVTAMACSLALGSARPTSAEDRRQTDGWPEITPAEKQLTKVDSDPQADIVVFNNERNGKILRRADEWVNLLTCHWRAKVLTAAGRRFSEVHIPGGKYSRVSNLKARTIKPDGTVVNLASDQIFQKTTVVASGFKRSEWVFNFPAVEPGAILEYRYDRHDNFLAYIDPFYFEGPGVTLRARVTQAMPEEMGYQILCSRCPQGVQPTVKKWRDSGMAGKLYDIELTNLPGYSDEILMPPRREVSPRLEMVLNSWMGMYFEPLGRQDRLFTDWDSVAGYVRFNYEKAAKEAQSAMRSMVGQWVQGVEGTQEKTKIVITHVQNDFRYVYWDTVIGGVRDIDTILKDMSADNEEKAILAKAALKIIGVDSAFALVSGKHAGSINPDFFSLSQFTHAILALPKPEGGNEWIDPTISYASYGFIPWKDSGAKALLIGEAHGQLVDLPVRNEVSRTSYHVAVKPSESGRAELEIEAEYVREDAVDMRSDLAPAGAEAQRDYLKEWLESRQAGATLSSYSIENLDKFDEPLKIKMQAAATGIVTVTDQAVLVKGCILSGYESNPILRTDRRHPLNVDRGWNVQETVVIQAPEGMKAAALPPPTQMDSGVARISFQCNPSGDGGVRCLRVFMAPRKQWPPNLMEKVRRMFEEVVKADRTTVAFQNAVEEP